MRHFLYLADNGYGFFTAEEWDPTLAPPNARKLHAFNGAMSTENVQGRVNNLNAVRDAKIASGSMVGTPSTSP